MGWETQPLQVRVKIHISTYGLDFGESQKWSANCQFAGRNHPDRIGMVQMTTFNEPMN